MGKGGTELWDINADVRIGDPFPNDPSFQANPGGPEGLVTAVCEHILFWNLDVDSWPEIACQAAGRNLTRVEWEQFGPAGEPYHATCAQWPSAEDL